MSELKWFKGRKGGPVGAIPDIGLLDPNTPIQARSPEHEAAIIATDLFDETRPPKVQAEPEAPAETPTLADAAAEALTPQPEKPAKGGK